MTTVCSVCHRIIEITEEDEHTLVVTVCDECKEGE